MTFTQRLRTGLDAFLSLSLGVRIALGTLLAALSGSGLIAVVSEYATVNYALAHGARLPTEGIPYLKFAAAAFSFALFVVALGSFFVLYGVLRFFLTTVNAHARKSSDDLRAMPLRKFLVTAIPAAFVTTQPVVATLVNLPNGSLPEYVLPLVAVIMTILLVLFTRRPAWIYPFTALTFAILTGCMIWMLFIPKIYGDMLAFIRFGGGIPIELVRVCPSDTPCTKTVVGDLFLRTENYFYLTDKKQERITEIPAKDISEYRYTLERRWGAHR